MNRELRTALLHAADLTTGEESRMLHAMADRAGSDPDTTAHHMAAGRLERSIAAMASR